MRRKLLHQINMVPFIDIMLVLLVVFMVTATLVPTSVLELPSIGEAALPKPSTIHIDILNPQAIVLRTEHQDPVTLSLTQLTSKVQELLALNRQTPVVISASKDLAYDQVMQVMDLLQSAGVEQLGLAVKVAR
ncbi:MAG: biopolymer transporter ExbD [Gammaproteobacteria bacterium]|nr:biopolymer transporter ExbD [Gammaproteobacteria bacterium]